MEVLDEASKARAAEAAQEVEMAAGYLSSIEMESLLPMIPGWRKVMHRSNFPFYVHVASGACSWTRPYLIPSQTEDELQAHDPPMAAFHKPMETGPWSASEAVELTVEVLMAVFVERRRRHLQRAKDGTIDVKGKLLPGIPDASATATAVGVGKTAVSHLQEYCMNVLKTMPKYEVTQQEDPRNPFLTVVLINGEAMGRGAYSNKKTSKRLAAEDALKRLCPSLYEQSRQQEEEIEAPVEERVHVKNADEILAWQANDERLERLTVTAKTPLQLIYEYCHRYHVSTTWTEVPVTSAQNNTTFDVKCMLPAHDGRLLSASVNARTKKEGKQKVSHKILIQLYPKARTWGELVDLVLVNRRDEDDRVTGTLSFLERIKADIGKQNRSETALLPSVAASVAAHSGANTATKSQSTLPPVMYISAASGTAAARTPEFFNASGVRVATAFLSSLQATLGIAPDLDLEKERQRSASPAPAKIATDISRPAPVVSASASKYYQQQQQQQGYVPQHAAASQPVHHHQQYQPASAPQHYSTQGGNSVPVSYSSGAAGRLGDDRSQWPRGSADRRDRSPGRDRDRDYPRDHRDHREYRDHHAPAQQAVDYRYAAQQGHGHMHGLVQQYQHERQVETARAAPPHGSAHRSSHSPPAHARGGYAPPSRGGRGY